MERTSKLFSKEQTQQKLTKIFLVKRYRNHKTLMKNQMIWIEMMMGFSGVTSPQSLSVLKISAIKEFQQMTIFHLGATKTRVGTA
jgi:hypothetical protein